MNKTMDARPRAMAIRHGRSRRGAGFFPIASLLLLTAIPAVAQEEVRFGSPGLPDSRMGIAGQLLEDWGQLRVRVESVGPPSMSTGTVESVRLDGVIPAARLTAQTGPVKYTISAFRGPAWPGGIDVLTVNLMETTSKEQHVKLAVDLPEGARVGARTVSMGDRIVLSLPFSPTRPETQREWGFMDDASSLPGWARPVGECDPAFRNIRAGLGGVPIRYRFSVPAGTGANVALGLCESHWAQSGERPVVCRVEGAPDEAVDPLAKWGRHKPGALLFAGKDANGDGKLDIAVFPAAGAPDQNPILNVIWIFPDGPAPDLGQVIAGNLNGQALKYVDVGGEKDQSLYPPGKAEVDITLPASGTKELSFLVACQGGSVPLPDRTSWTPESLRRAALEVWRDWRP